MDQLNDRKADELSNENLFFETESQLENCTLSTTDLECGKIFFNELTRILKYACYFCELIYDDINLYCGHLGEHINKTLEAEESNTSKQSCDKYYMSINVENTGFGNLVEIVTKNKHNHNDESLNVDVNNHESCRQLFLKHQIEKQSDGSKRKFEKTKPETTAFQSPKKKEHKVTTVKIINCKNRITELYKQIELEEERNKLKKSENNECLMSDELQEIFSYKHMQKDKQDSNIHNSTIADVISNPTQPLVRQIGETLITLLPSIDTTKSPTLNSADTNKNEMESSKYACPACGKCFRNILSLASHKRAHYLESGNSIKLAHKCCDCQNLFNNSSDLRDHMEREHFPDGFICKICNKQFGHMAQLERHMRSLHLLKPYWCRLCSKAFQTVESFEMHRRCYHPENKDHQSFKCSVCGRKYRTEGLLQQHMKNHKKQVQLTCIVCGIKTLRLKQHMRTHIQDTTRTQIKYSEDETSIASKLELEQGEVDAVDVKLEQQRVIVKVISNQTQKTIENEDELNINPYVSPAIIREESYFDREQYC